MLDMPDRSLQKSVEGLRSEMNRIGEGKERKKEQIQELINDLENHIQNPGDKEHSQKIADSLPDLIKEFEMEHPKLTRIMNDILVILGNAGI